MRSYNSGATNFQAYPANAKLRYYGVNARNLGTTPVTVTIYHGVSNAGPVLSTLTLAAKQSAYDWPEAGGLPAVDGIYIERSGSSEVAVYFNV